MNKLNGKLSGSPSKLGADPGIAVLSRVLGTMTLMAVPGVGGWYLDKYFGTSFLIWVGMALGMIIGCVGLFLIVRMASIEIDRELTDGRKFRKLDDSDDQAAE